MIPARTWPPDMLRLPALLLTLALVLAQSGPGADAVVQRVLDHPKVQAAFAVLDRDHERMVSDIVTLAQIPAPPFKEETRAAAYLAMLRKSGLTSVEQDAEGNVMGVRKGTGGGPLVAVAAHLDTVFPEDTDVRVRRDGTLLSAPGIGDNTRSLAVLLAVVRALNEAGVTTAGDLLVIGNVGEEGPGDLRGMRYLFREGRYKGRIDVFVSIDGSGTGDHITNAGIGSRRYRVRYTAPGGHSYAAFGIVNPAFASANPQAMDAATPSSEGRAGCRRWPCPSVASRGPSSS